MHLSLNHCHLPADMGIGFISIFDKWNVNYDKWNVNYECELLFKNVDVNYARLEKRKCKLRPTSNAANFIHRTETINTVAFGGRGVCLFTEVLQQPE